MNETIITKSTQSNTIKTFSIFIASIGVLLSIAYILWDINQYSDLFYELASENYDWFEYTSPLHMASIQDGAFFIVYLFPIISVITAIIIYWAYSNVTLTVTDKRVFGTTAFGKRVDLPLDSISAVGTSSLNGISITTASGYIKFKFIGNRNDIYTEISQLLIDRQK